MSTKQPCSCCKDLVDVDAEVSWPILLLIIALVSSFYFSFICLNFWVLLLPATLTFHFKCSQCRKVLLSVHVLFSWELDPETIVRVVAHIKMTLVRFLLYLAYTMFVTAVITGCIVASQDSPLGGKLVPWLEFNKYIVQPSVQGDVFQYSDYFHDHYQNNRFDWTGMIYSGSYRGDEDSFGLKCRNLSMPDFGYESASLFICYPTAEDISKCSIRPPAQGKTIPVHIGGKMQDIGLKNNKVYLKCKQAWMSAINETQDGCLPGA